MEEGARWGRHPASDSSGGRAWQDDDDAYLLVPDGKGRSPLSVVIFYDSKTGVGLARVETLHFARDLARRWLRRTVAGQPRRRATIDEGEGPAPAAVRTTLNVAANCYNALAAMPNVDAKRSASSAILMGEVGDVRVVSVRQVRLRVLVRRGRRLRREAR